MTLDVPGDQSPVGDSTSGVVDNVAKLPESVKMRVTALKLLQDEHAQIRSKFYHQMHRVSKQYDEQFQRLYDKRLDIVSDPENFSNSTKVDSKGIPGFWFAVLKNAAVTRAMIKTHDEPILKHLTDIRFELSDPKDSNKMNYTLRFYFAENEYFSNEYLVKTFRLRLEPTPGQEYNGPEVSETYGCVIYWANEGADVTLTNETKTQRNSKTGETRIVEAKRKRASFFRFFEDTPDAKTAKNEEEKEELESSLDVDSELGEYFRRQIIPKAVYFYCGEIDGYDSDTTTNTSVSPDHGFLHACSFDKAASPKKHSVEPEGSPDIGVLFVS